MNTNEAITQILRSSWSIIKCVGCLFQNLGRTIDKAVTTYPWVCLTATLMAVTIFSFAQIGQARAERDKANVSNWELRQQNDSLETEIVCLEARLKQPKDSASWQEH